MPRRSDPIELTTRWAGYFFVLAAIALLSVVSGQEDVRASWRVSSLGPSGHSSRHIALVATANSGLLRSWT